MAACRIKYSASTSRRRSAATTPQKQHQSLQEPPAALPEVMNTESNITSTPNIPKLTQRQGLPSQTLLLVVEPPQLKCSASTSRRRSAATTPQKQHQPLQEPPAALPEVMNTESNIKSTPNVPKLTQRQASGLMSQSLLLVVVPPQLFLLCAYISTAVYMVR